jgi:cytochrome b subunit of formate dehydrogenase
VKKINLNLIAETNSQLERNIMNGLVVAIAFIVMTVVSVVVFFKYMTFDGIVMIVSGWVFWESLNLFLSAMIVVRLSRTEKTKRGDK